MEEAWLQAEFCFRKCYNPTREGYESPGSAVSAETGRCTHFVPLLFLRSTPSRSLACPSFAIRLSESALDLQRSSYVSFVDVILGDEKLA